MIVAAHADHPTKPVLASVLGVGDRGLRDGRATRARRSRFPRRPRRRLRRVAEHALWKRRPEGIVPDVSALGIDIGRATRSSLMHSTCGPPAPCCRGRCGHRAARHLRHLRRPGPCRGHDRRGCRRRGERARVSDRTQSHGHAAARTARKQRVSRSTSTPTAVRGAYGRMSRSLGVGMSEALVQKMIDPGLETAVGIRHDATFGPVVTFGLGGAFAEAIDDIATRVTPLTDRDAADLVRSARAWSVLADSSYALSRARGPAAPCRPAGRPDARGRRARDEPGAHLDRIGDSRRPHDRVAHARSDLGDPVRRMLRVPGEAPAPVRR